MCVDPTGFHTVTLEFFDNFPSSNDFLRTGNDCTLKCAQKTDPDLVKVKDGKCGECACTKNYSPVCGSNAITYGNQCEFECHQEVDLNLTKESDGKCPEEER